MDRQHLETAASLLIGVLAVFAYLASDTPEGQQVWHYVSSGLAMTLCALWLLCYVKSPLAKLGLCWLAWEQAQVAFCGIDSYGLQVPLTSGLCVVKYGEAPYLAATALALIYLWSASRGRRPNC